MSSVILTIRDGKRAGQRYEFDAHGEYLIGRAQECAVVLPADEDFLTVSRRHCLVEFNPPDVCVRDLGSRNGTYVNGMQIGRPAHWHLPPEFTDSPCQTCSLRDGDELRVGPTTFQVAICEEEDDPMSAEMVLCASS